MKNATRYAAAFGVGAVVGITNELVQNPEHWCINKANKKALITSSIANVYGWSTLIALVFFDIMRKNFPRFSEVALVLSATVLVGLAEGVFGQISKRFHNGNKTWQYPDSWIPMFDGYVSVFSSLFFGVGIAAFYWLLYKPYLIE